MINQTIQLRDKLSFGTIQVEQALIILQEPRYFYSQLKRT